MKRKMAVLLAILLITTCFWGCSSIPDESSSALLEGSHSVLESTVELDSEEESSEESSVSSEEASVSESSTPVEESLVESESSSSEESESSESSIPSLKPTFVPKVFNFTQEDGSSIKIELAIPDTWIGYEGDISLFRDTENYEEIKVMEIANAKKLENAADINSYISDPGYEGCTILSEKMYAGFGGSSVYYYKTEATPMGGTHELEIWYPCFYYILMPDNTFVNLVFYALESNNEEDLELFDTITDSLTIKTE